MRVVRVCTFFAYLTSSSFPLIALAVRAGDFWSDVTSLDAYQNIPECAQICVLGVTAATSCVEYSCVCSNDSEGGYNFITGVTNISGCAERSCSSKVDADTAVNDFRDICLVGHANTIVQANATATATPTQTATGLPNSPSETSGTSLLPIKPASYESLNPCSKFCLNSCRDINGTVNEPDCYAFNTTGAESYRGLADLLRCDNAACLCAGIAFNLTYGRLYQASVDYCDYLPSTSDQISSESDRLQGALADFCASNNFTSAGYIFTIVGTDPPSGLSNSDKIAIGIGVGGFVIALFALFFQGYSTFVVWQQRRNNS